jgi:hypothetical protein
MLCMFANANTPVQQLGERALEDDVQTLSHNVDDMQ